MIIDVKRNDSINKELEKRIKIINIYDQNLGRKCIYLGELETIKRTI